MDQALIDRIKADMVYEFAREAPPEGFPAFHDIPVDRHTSQEFADLEHEHLWPHTWVMAGRAEDVPEPGDYFLFKDLGVPLLIVRGTDGGINCFYNTCQHRGAPVVRDERGSSRRLRCQYHSWAYDIDGGDLVALPDERDFVDLDWKQRCLPQARCETFGGFIFVNRDLDAQPVAEWLGSAAEMFAPFDCENLREVYRESVIIPCNWKVTAEAFLEVYHFKHIHSHNGVSVLDNRGAAMGLYPNGHSRMITPYSEQNQQRCNMTGWDDWKPVRQGPFATIDGVPEMVDCTSTAVSLFPNIIVPLGRFGFPINLFWPLDKGTTRLDWIYYAPTEDGRHAWGDGDLPEYWSTRRGQYSQIMEEDMMNMAPMQESMESPALSGIPINYQERRIWHLHEQIDRMIGVEHIPAEMRVEQLLGPYTER
ncbi:MAG: aromatic ring-hydroxylating dioxygenase subunit alpha [Actinomycetota bacterium]|jgi:phenylpropionate dioxygenase-like ring-hydroxylating dioxygenase large terminal subunit|nr:aromatic ring-hydroxylating dioxygenase subunit alpha [Actinomycetota bacterium]